MNCSWNLKTREFVLPKADLTTNQIRTLVLRAHARLQPEGVCLPELQWHYLKALAAKMNWKLDGLQEFLVCAKRGVVPKSLENITSMTPTGSKELRPYQRDGAAAMIQQSLLLADDMGCGKTQQALQALYHYTELQPTTRALIVAPNVDVGKQWAEALTVDLGWEDWLELLEPKHLKQIWQARVAIITYAKVWRPNYLEGLKQWCHNNHTVVIVDEAHRLSSDTSKQYQGMLEITKGAARIWALTGTEMDNQPDGYCSIYKLLTGARVTKEEWISAYMDQRLVSVGSSGYNKIEWDKTKLKTFATVRRTFGIRRTKEEVSADLPEKTVIHMPMSMDPAHKRMYDTWAAESEVGIVGDDHIEDLEASSFFARHLRKYQISSWPGLLGDVTIPHMSKTDVLLDLLEGAGEQTCVVWSNWPKTIEHLAGIIKKHFPTTPCEYVHGSVDPKKRNEIRISLQEGKTKIVVANPAVWGEGVNLTAATVLIYWDYHPSRRRWKQSQDRSHRIGQTKPVTLYLPYYRGTIEDQTIAWLNEKDLLSEALTGQR